MYLLSVRRGCFRKIWCVNMLDHLRFVYEARNQTIHIGSNHGLNCQIMMYRQMREQSRSEVN
jgi:hypothetical protein